MEDKLYQALLDLKDEFNKSNEVILLKEKEKVMEEDSNVRLLRSSYLKCEEAYNDAVRLNLDLTQVTKDLSLAKSNLMNNELVQDYLKAYNNVKELVDEINSKLGVFHKLELPRMCIK